MKYLNTLFKVQVKLVSPLVKQVLQVASHLAPAMPPSQPQAPGLRSVIATPDNPLIRQTRRRLPLARVPVRPRRKPIRRLFQQQQQVAFRNPLLGLLSEEAQARSPLQSRHSLLVLAQQTREVNQRFRLALAIRKTRRVKMTVCRKKRTKTNQTKSPHVSEAWVLFYCLNNQFNRKNTNGRASKCIAT